jgi:hypothetical protein
VDVLLLNSNVTRCARVGYSQTPPPAGLISLAGALRGRGDRVQIRQLHDHVCDQDQDELPLIRAELERILGEFSPDAVGLSVRNFGAQRRPANPFHLVEYYSAFYDERVIRALRTLTRAPIVVGGTAFSVEPGLYLKYAKPDYGLVGEGEESFPALLAALENGEEPQRINGLVTEPAGIERAVSNCGHVRDMSVVGVGACDLVADYVDEYYAGGGMATIQTKRGCGLNCIYCTTPFFEGCGYRFRPMHYVIDEMRAYVKRWGVRHFYIVDATLNHPVEHAVELCNAILESGLDITWYAEANPGPFTDELCRLMKASGCIGVSLTPDSCSESVLQAYGKGFGIAEVRNAIDLLRKHDIPFQTHVILGGPGETEQTLSETLRFCSEHLQGEAISLYDGMVVTTRAPLHRIVVEEGRIDPAVPYEDTILANDFAAARAYEYFFPHLDGGRKTIAARMAQAVTEPTWLLMSRDYVVDPETREYTLGADIKTRPGSRPWWHGLTRDNQDGTPNAPCAGGG